MITTKPARHMNRGEKKMLLLLSSRKLPRDLTPKRLHKNPCKSASLSLRRTFSRRLFLYALSKARKSGVIRPKTQEIVKSKCNLFCLLFYAHVKVLLLLFFCLLFCLFSIQFSPFHICRFVVMQKTYTVLEKILW